ncbi:hypothetical protein IEO21_08656 [Rhodonia placenta]|uniref:Uncharacterized protein n=1 Tax=Rhodonia placenta TaxID=104341 RepID=A0A8H7TZ68_9APHY|nr:hypothetical protein IEO21_08656 [Postia placenta]
MPLHTTLVRKPPPTLSIHSLALCVRDVHARPRGLFLPSFLHLFLCLPYTRSLYTLPRAFPAAFPTPFLWPFLRPFLWLSLQPSLQPSLRPFLWPSLGFSLVESPT